MSPPAEPPAAGARERILDAAVERIASDGIDEARIARIAMDAGVSTSLVHYHFETREALLAEALEYSYELAGDVRIGEGEGRPDQRAAGWPRWSTSACRTPGALERDWILWVELWLRAVRHPELRPTAARLYARMHEWFADAIAAGVEAGEFRPADPSGSPTASWRSCDGFGIRALIGPSSRSSTRGREVWGVLAQELGVDPASAAAPSCPDPSVQG